MIITTVANCGHPELLSTCLIGIDSVTKIVGYDDIIAIEGSTIMFSCPPGLVLTGPNYATCMENREWEPDPRRLVCTG